MSAQRVFALSYKFSMLGLEGISIKNWASLRTLHYNEKKISLQKPEKDHYLTRVYYVQPYSASLQEVVPATFFYQKRKEKSGLSHPNN